MSKEAKNISSRAQWVIDDLFLPHGITQVMQEIKSLQSLRKHKHTTMRLPGTFNVVNNGLPTAQFLAHYKSLKQKQWTTETKDLTNDCKGGSSHSKVDHNKNNGTNDKAASKINAGDGNNAKPDTVFTKEQDTALIELKIKDTSWKAIAAELGKEVSQVKQRFNIIKPWDYDKRHNDAVAAKKDESHQQQKGAGGGGDNAGGGAQKVQGQDETANGRGISKKEKKIKNHILPSQEKPSEEASGDWWEQPDDNWSKGELEALLSISNDELRIAFGQMSVRLAKEHGRQVHPVSIAEKILSIKPAWS